MKTNEVKEVAIEIVKKCNTCKEVSEMFKELSEKYGKDNAVKIRAKAKELIKARKDYYTENAKKVIDATKDGNRVTALIWKDILKDKTINKFALLVYNHCDKSVENIINKYASYKTTDGKACIRHNSKKLGEYYTIFELSESNTTQALSMLRKAINNAKTACIKGTYSPKAVSVTE